MYKMNILQFIKSLIKVKGLSDIDIVQKISDIIESVDQWDYYRLVDDCDHYGINKKDFFTSLFMKASEDVQYQMWKDGYVDFCPAKLLLKDLEKEDKEIASRIKKDYDGHMPYCSAYFDGIQDVVLEHISQAEKSIEIAMAWFTNPVIFNRLLRACNRGISVELIINNDLINNRYNGLPFNKLIDAGAALYIAEPPKLIHNKFCIIDDRLVIDGSYNWTILAEKNNDENIVVIQNGNVIDSFLNAFAELTNNCEQVDKMPTQVPEKPEFDCCSYKNFNTEEWLEQINNGISKKKQREIYKRIFKAMPKEYSYERIPSEEFDLIKKEVEEEKTIDTKLFKDSICKVNEKLAFTKESKENEITRLSQKLTVLESKKTKIQERNKKNIERIKNKRITTFQKEEQLEHIKKEHRRELQKLSRVISSKNAQLSSLRSDVELIESQQVFANSIKEVDLKGSNGLCRVNLKWNTQDDLDLHLILPHGSMDGDNDIYYRHMKCEYNGGVCSLDHDAIPDSPNEKPQENIQWERCLPDGTYRIAVKLFNKKSNMDNIPFSISVFSGKQAKTEVFNFVNAKSGDVINVIDLIFKNGKLVAPIRFNSSLKI